MEANRESARLSRSATSRSCEPDRREGSYAWELWNLQALWPDAGPNDLDKMKERRQSILAREREALAGLWSGDRQCLTPGHSFLEKNPQLLSGLIVSSHLGPYRLAGGTAGHRLPGWQRGP